jgi:hypothetical protein
MILLVVVTWLDLQNGQFVTPSADAAPAASAAIALSGNV